LTNSSRAHKQHTTIPIDLHPIGNTRSRYF